MSVQAAGPGHAQAETARLGDDDRGYGWVMFAGTVLALVGTLNIIEGIAAISRSHFFVGNAHYVFGDLKSWGWTVLIIGAIQLLTGFGVLMKNQLARWVGVGFAALNAIAQLLMIPSYPFWSLTLFAMDILIMYGLIAYGGRSYRTA
jgi:hypothetical protein